LFRVASAAPIAGDSGDGDATALLDSVAQAVPCLDAPGDLGFAVGLPLLGPDLFATKAGRRVMPRGDSLAEAQEMDPLGEDGFERIPELRVG